MVHRNLSFSLALAALSLPLALQSAHYDRPINIITSDYDLVDTTYIDRGRLDGVKVGDHFQVKQRSGKLAAEVVVTGVFERMASVKVVDQWFLKEGQLGGFEQRPMVVALQNKARRVAPVAVPAAAAGAKTASPAAPAAAAPTPASAAAAPTAPGAAPAGLPSDPGMPDPAGDMGLPADPGAAPAGLPSDPGMPDPAGDMSLPADPGLPAAPDAGIPPPPGDDGLPPI